MTQTKQNYLVCQPISRYFKRVAGVGSGNYIYFWKSKGLTDKKINSIVTSNYSITPELSYFGTKIRAEFNRSCLKQDNNIYNHGKIVNIYIVYEISNNFNISSYPTLEHCLFGAISLTKNNDIDKYKYSGYGIGFDEKGSLHYNVANSYLFVNGTEIIKFKAKDSEIVATPLCLGNISKDFSEDNMKKMGLYGCGYDFSVDYDAIAVHDILDIHKYLMKKNNMI